MEVRFDVLFDCLLGGEYWEFRVVMEKKRYRKKGMAGFC